MTREYYFDQNFDKLKEVADLGWSWNKALVILFTVAQEINKVIQFGLTK